MEKITITLAAAQWNIILQALAGRPFGEVSELIPEIQKQAQSQIQPSPADEPATAQ